MEPVKTRSLQVTYEQRRSAWNVDLDQIRWSGVHAFGLFP
ncbi:hypothetical protein DB30_06572 [Enhygromyxa salina]|uniref:Uncharacterized protein n=1 Tax=Enhygromyxa salina TaxID=215803 RepID=A0A0C2D6Z7_9BACT|nr:hypothetical protein DB30_06572 [Enhygromyxa salina]